MRLGRRRRAHVSDETAAPTSATSDGDSPAADEHHTGGADRDRPPRRVLRATRQETPADHANGAVDDDPIADEPGDQEHVAAAGTEATGAHADGDEARPERRRSAKGRIRALFDEQVAESREEAERQAAEELRQFMEPARQQLVLNVPGSSSPEEAEAMLAGQAAIELGKAVDVRPEDVIDLRNPTSMRAYPPAEKLSNRVLRLADRHWTKDKPRPSADVRAEKAAIAEREFARKPAGTQRCLALRGSLRCRGVFAFRADEQAASAILACPACGAAHAWDVETGEWVLRSDAALARADDRSALTTGT